MIDFITYSVPSDAKSFAIDAGRLALAAVLFAVAAMFAIPSIPSHEPVAIAVPSATVVTVLAVAGLIAIPPRGWARWAGFTGFAAALWVTIWIIGYGVTGGAFWSGDVIWVKGNLP